MRRRRIESLERFEFIVAWWLQERVFERLEARQAGR
jgi:hypothetical protein